MSSSTSQTTSQTASRSTPQSAAQAVGAANQFVSTYDEVARVRLEDPSRIARLAAARRRRTVADTDGTMMVIAADHPARGALGVGIRPHAMESRRELLDRMREALAVPGVDGVLGTADILEDLLLLGALEDKIVFASMNRGGLQGSSWEIEDRFTAYDAAAIEQSGFDGGKMLTRIDLADDRTSFILEASANAVTDLARHELIAMVEPFMSSRPGGGKIVNDLSPEAVIKSIHIAQGLGATSAYTWLKLPAVDDMERVMDATALPTLILGGDPANDDPDTLRATWKRALDRPNVRGPRGGSHPAVSGRRRCHRRGDRLGRHAPLTTDDPASRRPRRGHPADRRPDRPAPSKGDHRCPPPPPLRLRLGCHLRLRFGCHRRLRLGARHPARLRCPGLLRAPPARGLHGTRKLRDDHRSWCP